MANGDLFGVDGFDMFGVTENQRGADVRVWKGQFGGAQEKAGFRSGGAVAPVPHERHFPGGKLNPDLVRPAGAESDLYPRRAVRFLADQRVGKPGFPHATSHSADRIDLVFHAVVV